MMKIALDVMGGDYAPDAIIQGALLAAEEFPEGAEILLVGNENQIREKLKENEVDENFFSIAHADEVISMDEHPTKSISQKPGSSISVGYQLLKDESVNAFCSAGNTGAMLVGSMLTIEAIPGIIRPGIASFMPKESGKYGIILDIGANAECKAEVLKQFAEIGTLYARHVFKVDTPKVGLMNMGEEEKKGPAVIQSAYQLIKQDNSINFIGNIEGRDLFNDKADVIVCDGFTGNVILKMGEAIYGTFKKRKIQDEFLDMMNYEAIGGSPVLGVNGNVIIGHGVSSPKAINSMLNLSLNMVRADMSTVIKENFK